MLKSYISSKAKKGSKSKIEGRGLFASQLIKKEEIVAIKGGHIIDGTEYKRKQALIGNSDVQIADNHYIAALSREEYEGVMLFLNHSCNPNVGVAGNIIFVAMRDIKPNEELTIDYAMIDGEEDLTMVCSCGSKNCRKRITGRDWKIKDLQEKYKGYFSWYLEQRIQNKSDK